MRQSYWALGQRAGCHCPGLSQGQPRHRKKCRRWPHPLWFSAHSQVWECREDVPYAGLQKAGRKEKGSCLPCSSGASVTVSPPGPASCYTAAFLFSSLRPLVVPTSSSNSSYSAQQSEPLHRLQAAGGFAGSRSAMCQPSAQRGAWTGVATWG